jgi:tripartite-type tricarboxylate transporter receptor subunit TctC
MNYATVGVGTATHLSAERFRLSAGFTAQNVPFTGAQQALTEVMAGRIGFSFMPALAALPLIRDGKLRALAVGSSNRASSLPDVPTTTEAGFANSAYNFWLGVFAPAKTPETILDRLSAETRKALQLPSVQERLPKLAVEPMLFDA